MQMTETTVRSWAYRIVLLAFAAAVLLVSFAVVEAAWTFRARLVVLYMTVPTPITEEEAVEASRRALHQVGEDETLFTPRAWDGRNLFARNTLTPTEGYVLWEPVVTGTHPGFAVNVEQSGSTVRCEVCRCK